MYATAGGQRDEPMQRESAVEAMRVVRVCIAELEQAIEFAREYEKDPRELRNFAGMIAPVMDAIVASKRVVYGAWS